MRPNFPQSTNRISRTSAYPQFDIGNRLIIRQTLFRLSPPKSHSENCQILFWGVTGIETRKAIPKEGHTPCRNPRPGRRPGWPLPALACPTVHRRSQVDAYPCRITRRGWHGHSHARDLAVDNITSDNSHYVNSQVVWNHQNRLQLQVDCKPIAIASPTLRFPPGLRWPDLIVAARPSRWLAAPGSWPGAAGRVAQRPWRGGSA